MALSKVDLANQVENQLPQGLVANNLPYRNIIINGDMSIAQRGTSQATAGSSGGSYQTLDRYKFFNNNLGAFTWSQDTDVPSGQGFATSMKFDCTTADATPAAADYLFFSQYVEAQNCQYLKQGTANAQSLTLSFWVKSTKTGTYCFDIRNIGGSRLISKNYTISSSNTWEKKTITFAGDTVGTIPNNNGQGLQCSFWLAAGSNYTSGTLQTSWGSYVAANRAVGQVNLADSTANDFFITGVQIEAGTTASDFESLPYDVNLQRCQRYFQKISSGYTGIGCGWANGGSDLQSVIDIPVQMRASPTFSNFTAMGAMPANKSNSSPGINAGPTLLENGKIWFQSNGWGGTLTNQEIYIIAFSTNACFMSAEL